MRELENLVVLSSNIRLYVPSTQEVDTQRNNEEEVRETAELFSSCFGGATAYKAIGCWKSALVGLVTEEVTIVESFCDEERLSSSIGDVIGWARSLKSRMSQEAVGLEVNGRLYLV